MTLPPKTNLLGMNRSQLEDWFAALGERPYRATQVLKWVHRQGVLDFAAMTDLGKGLRSRLQALATLQAPQVVHSQVSADGTHKWLLRVDSANCIEAVFIPDAGRGTLCVSSQVGCGLDCRFCATAQEGFNRNLTSAEIIGQLHRARFALTAGGHGERPITNVVLMGMGEPLLNFDPVTVAMDLMLEDCAYGLARRRVTLSTAGVVPGIRALKERCPVSLAVSLHAPEDSLRDTLVPINKKYPIAELLAACRDYAGQNPKQNARQPITFEYVMLDGVNDSVDHAKRLGRLLATVPAKVNLIPFNPFPHSRYRRSSEAAISAFREVLLAGGLMTMVRKTRGEDIAAACGQLAGQVQARSQRITRLKAARQSVAMPVNPPLAG